MSLLVDFISKCAFIHDDIDPYLFSETGQYDRDQFSTNPFLVGAKVCVVDSLDGFGEPYLEHLLKLDSLPTEILVPNYQVPSLVQNLIKDTDCCIKLRNLLLQHSLDVSAFCSSRALGLEDLMRQLVTPAHTPRLHPSILQFEHLNDKVQARLLLESVGLPVPQGMVCYSASDLLWFWKSRRRYPRMVLKRVHWNSLLIEHDLELENLLPSLVFPLVAETFYESAIGSPVAHFVKWGKQIEHLFTLEQTIIDLKHCGNSFPCQLPMSVQQRIAHIGLELLSGVKEYVGVAGIDFLVTEDEELFVIDLNPRFNASTYPCFFLVRQGYRLDELQVVIRVIEANVDDLSCLFSDPRFVPFKYPHGGILLYNPVWDFKRGGITRFSCLYAANSRNRLNVLEKAMGEIVV